MAFDTLQVKAVEGSLSLQTRTAIDQRGREREIGESEMSNLNQQPHRTKYYMFLQLPSSYLCQGLSCCKILKQSVRRNSLSENCRRILLGLKSHNLLYAYWMQRLVFIVFYSIWYCLIRFYSISFYFIMLYFCPNFILIPSFSFVIPSSSDPYLAPPENIGKSQLHFTQSGPSV